MKCKRCGHRMNVKQKIKRHDQTYETSRVKLFRTDIAYCGRCKLALMKEYYRVEPMSQEVKIECKSD